MSNDNGGQAFPQAESDYSGSKPGMTLRQYYVGHLLSGLGTDLDASSLAWFEQIGAGRVTKLADIMIAELNKGDDT